MVLMYCQALIFMKKSIEPCIYRYLDRLTYCRLNSLSSLCSTDSLRGMPSMEMFVNRRLKPHNLDKIQVHTRSRSSPHSISYSMMSSKSSTNWPCHMSDKENNLDKYNLQKFNSFQADSHIV